MTTYEKIKDLCEKAGFSISALSKNIPGVSVNRASITGWKNGSKPRPEKIKAIADFFGVTTEYLLDDTAVNVNSINDNHGIIGHTHAPVTIINGSERKLSEQELALLDIFQKIDIVKQARLLSFAAELDKEEN